jgi:SAM-dependent methyltransferase
LKVERPTRGHGVLEGFLARKRRGMAEKLIPGESREGRLLDIGCGSYPLFLRSTRFAEKWGVDQVFQVAEKITLEVGEINLLPFNAQNEATLPFPDSHFSVVTMLAVFEHIAPDRLSLLLREAYRVLQPGGVYVITTPAHWTDWLLKLMARLGLVSDMEVNEHKGSYRHREIAQALEAAGFTPSRMRFGHFEVLTNLWVTATK